MREAPARQALAAAPAAAGVMTPLREIEPGLLMKFELDQAGGSHKARAARFVVSAAIAQGQALPGVSTVVEKTGGNFGVGLALACREAGMPLELAVGLSFSQSRRDYLRCLGVTLLGEEDLRRGATPRQVVEARLAELARQGRPCYYPDQFHNPACVSAHEQETGAEIVRQLDAWPGTTEVHLVACAGTGAHVTGIARALRSAGIALRVTLVEPAGCDTRAGHFVDHPLEGMSVGVCPPLLDWSLVNQQAQVAAAASEAARQWLAQTQGYWLGRTSAACLAAARLQARAAPAGSRVLVLAYDHGAWYPATPPA